jgi:feruloyl-CoA synthase
MRSPLALGAYEHHLGAYLERWALRAGDRTFLAQRGPDGAWRRLFYKAAWARSCAIGQALLERGLGPDRPVAILTGNSIEHALVTFGAMLAGVPVAPISPSYSLSAEGLVRLNEIADLLQPALVFVQSAASLSGARALPALAGAEWVSAEGDADTTPLSGLEATAPGSALKTAFEHATGDTVAKILFTSGSTGSPKGVLNTQRMLCSAIRGSELLFPVSEPPVMVDWMPWHHTMGGNTSLHGTLRDGGTLYIDEGRPLHGLFRKTIANLTEISATVLQNVPGGFQLLVEAMETDSALRRRFFARMSRIVYAGASLPQEVWRRMQRLAVQEIGEAIPFISGYGATETGPGISATHWAGEGLGEIGLPIPGVQIKLIPFEDRFEILVRGPNVTPGYLNRPDLTAQAFDDEGFYRVGDAVQFVDPKNPAAGLRFAGRLSENFKLSNGSWVLTGELRTAVIEAAPSIAEAVVAGHDRDDVRLLVWATPSLRASLGATCEGAELERRIGDRVREDLDRYNVRNIGATRRIAAFHVLQAPPSLAAGETTDKGYVNQRAVLEQRAELVARLYDPVRTPSVVLCDPRHAVTRNTTEEAGLRPEVAQ